MFFSIRIKLFVLLTGLTAAVLGGALYAITETLESDIKRKILFDFEQHQAAFTKEERLRYERLAAVAKLITENGAFKAAISLDDPATVYDIVDRIFSPFLEEDLFLVTNREGMALALLGQPDYMGKDLTALPGVDDALQGDALLGQQRQFSHSDYPQLWTFQDKIYHVVTVPAFVEPAPGQVDILGTVTLGLQITVADAERLKGNSNIDITFLYNDNNVEVRNYLTMNGEVIAPETYLDYVIIGSTLSGLTQSQLMDFQNTYRQDIDAAIQSLRPTQPFKTVLGEGEKSQVFAFISPVGRDAPAFYVASIPEKDELAILDEMVGDIRNNAGISLGFTLVLAFILGRTLSQPIRRLVEAMNHVKEGELNLSLKPSTRDEIGLLTSTFNEMIGGLRERLQLMRYVGSHTQEMIHQASGTEVSLGGSHQELAVLFSDIRGFTAYSEKRQPEEVIAMLNRYLGFQAEIVPKYEGSIDKFVGDEMVALFIGERALERAIDCSVEIQRRVSKEHETDPMPIHIGIGVNFGRVILGNMGAQNRLDYTVIGAEVNMGARLCDAAPGGHILIRRALLDGLDIPVKIDGTEWMEFKGVSEKLEIATISCSAE
jgi:class 3 adenylate cyclase